MPFWGKKKDKGESDQAPSSTNPYQAQPSPANDPYARPPAGGQSTSSFSSPPPYNSVGGRPNIDSQRRDEKSPVPPGGYGGNSNPGGARYGGSRPYADQGGYGSTPYGGNNGAPRGGRQGGYGGFGDSTPADEKRDAPGGPPRANPGEYSGRYGNSNSATYPERNPSGTSSQYQQREGYDNEYGYGSGGYGQTQAPRYKPHEDPNATEEDQIRGYKDEIAEVKEDGIRRMEHANALAEAAIQQAMGTSDNLDIQQESLQRTARNLAQTNLGAEISADNVKELHAAQGMFGRPTFKKNREKDLARLDARSEAYRVENERLKAEELQYKDNNRFQRNLGGKQGLQTRDQSKKNQYILDDDDEDDAAREDQLDNQFARMEGNVSQLKGLAGSLNRKIESQTEFVGGLDGRAVQAQRKIAENTHRLNQIGK